jgi:hypothetical protein
MFVALCRRAMAGQKPSFDIDIQPRSPISEN